MSAERRFAEGTTVAAEKSRAEIEATLARYGADGFAYAYQGTRTRIEFTAHRRHVRFEMTLPEPGDEAFWKKTRGYGRRPADEAQALYEAEVRRMWRALLLAIKAKLEVVSSRIATFEQEFLAHIVLPDGRTAGEHVVPAIARAYDSGSVSGRLLPPTAGGEPAP